MNTDLFKHARILFTIRFCPHCKIYNQVLERINIKLPLHKRIAIIDCTKYHDFEIVDNPLISVFAKHINGNYPTLFFEGEVIRGANSKEELEAWLYNRLYNDFIVEEKGKFFMYTGDCEWKKTIWGKKPICH